MTAVALAGLAGLALVDSTSFGTLVLPLMMLLSPQVRTRNVVVHLGTLAVFYFGVEVLLLLGGVALVLLSYRIDPRAVAKRRARRGLPPAEPSRWRRRALGPDAT